MQSISLKISSLIIVAEIFITVIFLAIDYKYLNIGLYIILFFLIIFIFLFGISAGQNIAAPIKKMLNRAFALANGDLSSRVYIDSEDEVGELAKVFNKIADDLQENKIMSQKADEMANMKVKVKTESLEEIIASLEQKVKNRSIELEKIISLSEKYKKESFAKNEEIDKLKLDILSLKQGENQSDRKPHKKLDITKEAEQALNEIK